MTTRYKSKYSSEKFQEWLKDANKFIEDTNDWIKKFNKRLDEDEIKVDKIFKRLNKKYGGVK